MLTVGAVAAASLMLLGSAAAGKGFKANFQGQSHHARPGTAWAFYIRVSQNGKPWQGAVTLDVQTTKGKIVDHVGRYGVDGSLLLGYLWNTRDRGSLIFKAVFTRNGRNVGQTTYPVTVG